MLRRDRQGDHGTEGTGVLWAAGSAADIGPMSQTERGVERDTLWTLATHESTF